MRRTSPSSSKNSTPLALVALKSVPSGVYGQEKNYIDFTPQVRMAMLAHTSRETKRLGMNVDLTSGTGWPFGGSMFPRFRRFGGIVLDHFDKLPDKDFPMGKLVAATVYPPGREPVSIDPHPFETGAWFDTPPDGRWTLAFQTGPQQKVKRSAPGAEGNVLDPYSTASLDHYLSVFDDAFKNFPDNKPRSQFHDSFEYFSASWTPNFFDEFQKRRGYDLRPHLRELNNEGTGGGDADTISRVKCDYRETLSDLHLAYMTRWVAWSHPGGPGPQPGHGGPATSSSHVYANADIPECEMFHLYDETQLPFLKLWLSQPTSPANPSPPPNRSPGSTNTSTSRSARSQTRRRFPHARRRQPHVPPRHPLLPRRCRLARLAVLRLRQLRPLRRPLERLSRVHRLRRSLPVHSASQQTQ